MAYVMGHELYCLFFAWWGAEYGVVKGVGAERWIGVSHKDIWKNIDKEGIQPDIKVELTDENIKNKQDPQLDKATETVKQ